MPGSLSEIHKIVIQGPVAGEGLTRSWHKNPLKISPTQKSFHTSTSKTWHLQDLQAKTFDAKFDPDFRKIFWQGPTRDHARTFHRGVFTGSPQHFLLRTCAGSRRDLLDDVSQICQIFTKSSHTDYHKLIQDRARGFHQDVHKIVTRSWSTFSYTTGTFESAAYKSRKIVM
jgi:hypothetical protein